MYVVTSLTRFSYKTSFRAGIQRVIFASFLDTSDAYAIGEKENVVRPEIGEFD